MKESVSKLHICRDNNTIYLIYQKSQENRNSLSNGYFFVRFRKLRKPIIASRMTSIHPSVAGPFKDNINNNKARFPLKTAA